MSYASGVKEEKSTVSEVFEKVSLNHLTLKNRLVRSATWEGIGRNDGSLPEEAYDIYRELAKGGIGAIITGFTSVALHDYYFEGMMRLCDDALIPQYINLPASSMKRMCRSLPRLPLADITATKTAGMCRESRMK